MINTLQAINRLAVEDPAGLVRQAEHDYLSEIETIAQHIAGHDAIKIVSIAGPSASGKTTTAHILRDRLNALGETTDVVSLDNFYLPDDLLPLLPDGRQDIESVHALDLELLGRCFHEIILHGRTGLPEYIFSENRRVLNARQIDIGSRGIVIVEGLHALNPLITGRVPGENIFKLYISVNAPIMDSSRGLLLSSRQMRLMRRALRDEIFRGSNIHKTLTLWEGVVSGEERFLYCFKDAADVQMKTLHPYEPCVFRERFIAMQKELRPDTPCRDYFLRTVAAAERFVPMDASLVPHGSLLREFIGNGRYNP